MRSCEIGQAGVVKGDFGHRTAFAVARLAFGAGDADAVAAAARFGDVEGTVSAEGQAARVGQAGGDHFQFGRGCLLGLDGGQDQQQSQNKHREGQGNKRLFHFARVTPYYNMISGKTSSNHKRIRADWQGLFCPGGY